MAYSSDFYASVSWDDTGIPTAEAFNDPYFSKVDPVAESQYVFLDSNQIEKRFFSLTKPFFTICETGFGTGLNALLTLDAWLKRPSEHKRWLNFISFEKFPLSPENFAKAHQNWPHLAKISASFRERLRHLSAGWHHIEWPEWRFSLTLIIEEAESAIQQLTTPVDAWYLDGFAPSCNQGMWTPTLYKEMARLSHSETTLATFTAAGHVRRGLAEAGFTMQKAKGFGTKRDMLVGHYAQNPLPSFPTQPEEAIVIGSGLAGASMAYTLATKGIKVKVLEKSADIATGASGNPRGVLHIRPGKTLAPLNRLTLSGYCHTLDLLRQLDPEQCLWSGTGTLQLIRSEQIQQRFETALSRNLFPTEFADLLSPEEASIKAGVPIEAPCLFFPDSGWVSPKALCQRLLDHPNIKVEAEVSVSSLNPVSDGWQIECTNRPALSSKWVFLANGPDGQTLLPEELKPLLDPLIATRGQLTRFPQQTAEAALSSVICDQGYLIPGDQESTLLAGATFQKNDPDPELRFEDHQENIEKIRAILPDTPEHSPEQLSGRVAFRAQVKDLHPMVGKLAEGLWLNTAHGSRGLITAPLCSLYCVNDAMGNSQVWPMDVTQALSPYRFIHRKTKTSQ